MTFKFILGKSKYSPVRYDISIARKKRIKGLTNFSISLNWIDDELINELKASDIFKERTIIFKEKKEIPKGYKIKFKNIKDQIDAFEEFIDKELTDLKSLNLLSIEDSLKERIDVYFKRTQEHKKKKDLTFLQFIDFYAEFQKNRIIIKKGIKIKISSGTIKQYYRVKEILNEFQKYSGTSITYENIDREFIEEFQAYLIEEKRFQLNTVGKYVKHINTLMNQSRDFEYNTNLKFHKGFTVFKENKKWDYLSKKELDDFEKLELSEIESAYRDYFLLMSYTGMRVGDMLRLNKSNIIKDKNYITFLERKTTVKRYFSITDDVNRILTRWNNSFPNDILDRKITDSQINKFLKDNITNKLIRCHSGRREYCTLEYLKGTPIEDIMHQSGHKDYKTFKNYIVASGDEIMMAMNKRKGL